MVRQRLETEEVGNRLEVIATVKSNGSNIPAGAISP
jgi:hypothetical protein